MRDLNYQLKMRCNHSHEGSFETPVGRERQLSAIANQLHELGFRQLNVAGGGNPPIAVPLFKLETEDVFGLTHG